MMQQGSRYRVRNCIKAGSKTGTFIMQDNIVNENRIVHCIYDPTNGSMSRGEVFQPGRGPVGDTGAVARFAEGRR